MTLPQTRPVTALAAWLATRSPEQLASLIAVRSDALYGRDPRTLEELADRLMSPHSVSAGQASLTLAGHQVLTAAARLATEFKDLAGTATRPASMWVQQFGYRVGSRGGTVVVEELLRALGAGQPGAVRDAALRAVQETQALALSWPHGAGILALPGPVLDLYAKRQEGEARTIDRNLTSSFNKEPVGIIAETLDVGRATGPRAMLQNAVVGYLSDAGRVRELVGSASAEARRYLDAMLDGGGLIATKVFPKESSYSGKYTIAMSYPDPDSLWLARRALILPAGPDRAEVPVEVVRALRDGAAFAFSPQPVALPQVTLATTRARGEAQAALAGAVAKVGRLLEALDQQPVAPRKTGGLPVRETRRLAKVMRLDETETRFWIGLADQAGLIDLQPEHDGHLLCPTELSDRWLDSPAPERLAGLARTWLGVDDVITWWPFANETPIAYGDATDPYAVRLRAAVLNALATLPPGSGCLHATAVVNLNGSMPAAVAGQLEALTRATTWFAPTAAANAHQPAQQVLYTVYEAELLGVAAHGSLTDVGRALLAADEAGVRAAAATLLPTEQKTARFQADMTVVVTGTPTAQLATLLGTVADRESDGHAVVYRISAATLRRALDGGAHPADLLAQLTEVADGELPQALVYTINEVGRAHNTMQVVRSACCIRCDDPALVAELAKARALAKLGLRMIAPTVLISVRSPTETLAALRSASYAPTLEAETGITVIERVRGRRATGRPSRAAVALPPHTALKLARRLLPSHP